MVFNSDVFIFLFFPVVFSLFWLARTKDQRYILLTISGYVFYGYWNWLFCFLLLFSSLVSLYFGIAIQNSENPSARRWLMTIPIVVDLGLLGFFKYYGFLAATLHDVIPAMSL